VCVCVCVLIIYAKACLYMYNMVKRSVGIVICVCGAKGTRVIRTYLRAARNLLSYTVHNNIVYVDSLVVIYIVIILLLMRIKYCMRECALHLMWFFSTRRYRFPSIDILLFRVF